MGDGKALYLFSDHSHWKCRNYPFLLCACRRGESGNEAHVCAGWDDDKYIEQAAKCSSRWKKRSEISKMRNANGIKGKYDSKAHKKWIDEKNLGVSSKGVLPANYLINNLRLDVFHGRGNVVKIMLMYIRRKLDGMYDAVVKFQDLLLSFGWGPYQVDQWVAGDYVTRLKGFHTKSFTRNADKVIECLNTILSEHTIQDFCIALKTWHKISQFLGLVIIDDIEKAKEFIPGGYNGPNYQENVAQAMIECFDTLVKRFYEHGMDSFISKHCRGDKETFYLHAVRWYMPKIIRDTYTRHKLGPGIFTMEGFEYKNFSSKQAVRNHSNHRGNVPKQSLKHLLLSNQYN